MKTVLLETNAISRCLDSSLSGTKLLAVLNKNNFIPVVNIHTKYELARTFLNHNSHDRGKNLFLILKEINPVFSCPTDELIKREFQKLQNETSVTFVCNPESLKQIYNDIDLLSKGKFVQEIKTFIQKRERGIKAFLPTYNKLITKENRILLKHKSYKNFVNIYVSPSNTEELKTHLNKIVGKSLTDAEILKFRTNIASYPAIKTNLLIDLYLNYTVIKNGNKPAKDKIDDLRHLIDASYCSVLVTNDQKLTLIAREISPETEILTFEDLIKL